MKRILVMIVLCTVIGCGFSGAGPKKYTELEFKKQIPWPRYKISTTYMENGVRFFLIEDHELPLIKVDIEVKGGRFLVPKGKEGLEYILAQMLRLGGCDKYPGDRLDLFLEDRAAEFSIDFDFINGSIEVDTLKNDFTTIMPVIIDVLSSPIFTRDKLELAKQRLKTIISRRNDRQDEVGIREFKRLIYGRDSIYGRIPTYESVDNITLKDVGWLYKRIFVGSNLLVGVVGDFNTREIEPVLKKWFSVFNKGEEIRFKFPKVTSPQGKRYIIDTQDTNQAFVVLGHLGDYRLNPDFAALQVMNLILSGGFSGRLFENIRTQMGLAYSVFGNFGCKRFYPGVFFVALKTKNQSVYQAIVAVKKQLKDLKYNGCTEKEVEDAKDQFLNSLVFRYDSPKKVLERRLYYELRDMPDDSFDKLINEIRNIHAKDVDRVAKKYLNVQGLDILVVGDKSKLDELNKIGKFDNWHLD